MRAAPRGSVTGAAQPVGLPSSAVERSRWPLAGSLAGALVGCLIVGGLIASGALVVPRHRDDRDASAEFLQAWERSRTGTFIVESDFRRRLGDGRTLYSASKLVQSRPNRIIRQFGGIDGVVNGHPIVCSTDQGGNFSCFAGRETALDFDEAVARELDTFRSYFADAGTALPVRPAAASSGTAPPGTAGSAPGTTVPLVALGLYRVGHGLDAGCFELFQKIPYPDAPYGTYAKICFEQDTGAMTFLQRRLANNVVETLEAFRTSVAVGPSDFDTSADNSYKLRMDLGGFPEPVATPGGGTSVPPGPAGGPPGQGPGGDALAAKSNVDLIVDGSAVVRSRGDTKPYVAEVVKRMHAGTLSINSPDWMDGGRVRSLLTPVVFELLGTGIYYGPSL